MANLYKINCKTNEEAGFVGVFRCGVTASKMQSEGIIRIHVELNNMKIVNVHGYG